MNQKPPQQSVDRKYTRSKVKSPASGFALILVLWVLSLLTIMAGSFALTMRRESTITAGIKDNAGAVAAAEAGIAFAEMMLLHPEQNKRWRTDGNIYEVDFGDTQIRLRLLSEAGKIDINKANLQLLQGLMAQMPIDEEQQAKIIGAILDWRDPDSLLNIDGAEKKEYRKAGLKYQPRNKPFQTVEELQMVLGMDEQVFNRLEPIITIYSGQPQVNLKLATPKVLHMLPSLDADLIASFVATRLDNAKNDLPAPEFPSALAGGTAGAGVGAGAASNNETVTIISEALLPDNTSAVVTATVMKSGGGTQTGQLPDGTNSQSSIFKILKWQRNPANQEPLFTDEMNGLLVKQYGEPELND